MGLLILTIGVLMLIFPEQLAKAFPYLLGAGLIVRGAVIVFLALKYKEETTTPGKIIPYWAMGLITMILGAGATGIIGVIWAVFSLEEVSDEINEMWKHRHFSVLHLITAIISVGLAVTLIINPFEHFVTHVRVLGLEIIFLFLSRAYDTFKARKKQPLDSPEDETKQPSANSDS